MDGTMTGRDREPPAAIAPTGYTGWLVGAVVAALCVAAPTAIGAFLVGDFRETKWRIFPDGMLVRLIVIDDEPGEAFFRLLGIVAVLER